MFNFGLENLLDDPKLLSQLKGKRIGLVAHPASTNKKLQHAVDLLHECPEINLTCAFGPQHGLKGDKQDNMVETKTEVDPQCGFPIFSLYGEVRRPTSEMMEHFDVLLYDLQDVGCRIYTYFTTLIYLLEDCKKAGKELWILDRPNPAGRPIEGMTLQEGWLSFVGGAPTPMRHGLTMGEAAKWFNSKQGIGTKLKVVSMSGYKPEEAPGYGWPWLETPFVNPSPNLSSINSMRTFCGTVLLEGTTLSEGRGTTTALELFGDPEINGFKLIEEMKSMAPDWMGGALIRPCFFEPTFHKHQGKLCQGIMIHTDYPEYQHDQFKPYRIVALALKVLRKQNPDKKIWRNFHYEYEKERLAIDLLNGSDRLRLWVEDPAASAADLESILRVEEKAWEEERREFLLY